MKSQHHHDSAHNAQGHCSSRGNFHIINPSKMRVPVIARETAEFDATPLKLAGKIGGTSKFSSADWSIIGRVHKDKSPRITKVVVEIKVVRKLRRSLKIGELQK